MDGAWRRPPKSMSDYGHTEPRYLSDLRRSNCGRGLAPDGGVSANRAVTEPLQSGASRIVAPPLPHLECVRLKNPVGSKAAATLLLIWNRPVNHAGRNSMLIWGAAAKSMSDYGHTEPRYLSGLRRSNCGRGLAPDGGVSANRAVTEPLQSGASRIVAPPLPHLECVRLKNPVGSKAAATLLLIWNRPVNHAGRNSMLIWGAAAKSMSDYGHTEPRYLSDLRRSNCGRGLAPDGGVSANRAVTEPLQSGASPLPHLECGRL